MTFTIHTTPGEGRDHLYLFYTTSTRFTKHFHISRVITAESLPLHMADGRTRTEKPLVSGRKSLTTTPKNAVAKVNHVFNF